jgi:hypothetical protein
MVSVQLMALWELEFDEVKPVFLQHSEGFRYSTTSGVPKGGFGGFNPPPPPNSEALPKLSRIPSSVEYTLVTTQSEYGFHSFPNWVEPMTRGYRPQIPVLSALYPQLNLLAPPPPP